MKWTNEEQQFLTDNWDKMTCKEICKNLNRTEAAIYGRCRMFDLNKRQFYNYNFDFFTTQSKDLAYFLGFHMADGYIEKNLRQITFNLQRQDKCILEYLRSLICANKPIRDYQNFDKRTNKYYYGCRLSFCAVKMSRLLIDHFQIPRSKTGNERIPTNLDFKFLPDFLRGYFDGDGSVNLYKNCLKVDIFCANRIFLEELKDIYNLGTVNKTCNIFTWRMATHESIEFRKIIYNNEPFALQRKKDKLMDYDISKLKSRKYLYKEIKFIKENFHKMGITEIAKRLNRTPDGVRNKVKSLGLKE